jgi:hypothetical protein
MKGKHHNHACPSSHIRLGSQAPPLHINQRLDNRHAQPTAGIAGGIPTSVELFKLARQVNPQINFVVCKIFNSPKADTTFDSC